ncbi:MAG: hypothetical protein ABIP71_11965, partial [Verrucomicrobiota bacterium]
QTCTPHDLARSADLEIGDTAGLETGATKRSADFQVCCSAGFQTRRPHDIANPADFRNRRSAPLLMQTAATNL